MSERGRQGWLRVAQSPTKMARPDLGIAFNLILERERFDRFILDGERECSAQSDLDDIAELLAPDVSLGDQLERGFILPFGLSASG